MVCLILGALLVVGLCGCREAEAEVSFSAWEERLCSLVDVGQDEYLGSLPAEEAKEALSLRAVYPGSYTGDDAQELLCLISIKDVPHVAGMERTVLLLTDGAGEKALGQTTLAADRVEVALTESAGRSFPLVLGVSVQQGVYTYSLEMYEATDTGWAVLPALEDLPQGGDYSYSLLAGDMIQVSEKLPTELPGMPPEYRSVGVWQWSPRDWTFVPYGDQ